VEVRSHAVRGAKQEADGVVGLGVVGIVARRDRQPRQRRDRLARHVERRPGGHDQAQARTAVEQRHRHACELAEVLGLVEDQEQVALRDRGGQRAGLRLRAHPERPGDGGDRLRLGRCRGERHPRGTVLVVPGALARQLPREARLAAAAGTADRQETAVVVTEEAVEFGELQVAAHEGGRVDREVADGTGPHVALPGDGRHALGLRAGARRALGLRARRGGLAQLTRADRVGEAGRGRERLEGQLVGEARAEGLEGLQRGVTAARPRLAADQPLDGLLQQLVGREKPPQQAGGLLPTRLGGEAGRVAEERVAPALAQVLPLGQEPGVEGG